MCWSTTRSTGSASEPELEELHELTPELVARVGELVRQLSSSAPAPPLEDLEQIASSPATRLLIARDEHGKVIGMLTLAVFRIPTGVRAWIEDVVVDAAARGRGVGAALTRWAVELAAQEGARTVELTSRPARVEANRLYRKLGFEPRETNVYRFTM